MPKRSILVAALSLVLSAMTIPAAPAVPSGMLKDFFGNAVATSGNSERSVVVLIHGWTGSGSAPADSYSDAENWHWHSLATWMNISLGSSRQPFLYHWENDASTGYFLPMCDGFDNAKAAANNGYQNGVALAAAIR